MQFTAAIPKVLIVDDQPNNLIALRRLLAQVDAEVYTAGSGQEALSLALDHDFALVLLDVQMPGMDGYEVAEWLRGAEKTENVPIIFLTAAYTDDAHRLQAYRSGAFDYLDKPVNDVVLLSKVRVFLELYRHRLQREHLLEQVCDLNSSLQSANRALEEKVQDLEGLAYTLSHDLRSPLRAINGFAAILEEELQDRIPPETAHLLTSIQRNSLCMNRLLDDLLTFFRVASVPFTAQKVDLKRIAEEEARACCEQGRYPQTEVIIGRLPVVIGDESALRLVVHNLLDNALKYSAIRERPRVEVGCRMDGDGIDCFVCDNGIGFDSVYGEKLFRVFERLVSCKDYDGTGVGLAIVERVVRRHRGRVWAEGIPGEGAIFHCRFPEAVIANSFITFAEAREEPLYGVGAAK